VLKAQSVVNNVKTLLPHTPCYSSVYSRKMKANNMTDKRKISDQVLLLNCQSHHCAGLRRRPVYRYTFPHTTIYLCHVTTVCLRYTRSLFILLFLMIHQNEPKVLVLNDIYFSKPHCHLTLAKYLHTCVVLTWTLNGCKSMTVLRVLRTVCTCTKKEDISSINIWTTMGNDHQYVSVRSS
jgi:hypothetical protein